VVSVKKSSDPIVFFAVKTPDGQVAAKSNTGRKLALPPAKYVVELDMPPLPDDQRKSRSNSPKVRKWKSTSDDGAVAGSNSSPAT
jgi:hypothetical protein